MAAPDIYNIQTMQPNMNNPDAAKSDICYLPSAPMQPVSPSLYPMASAPPPYAIPPPTQPSIYPTSPVFVTQMQVPYQGVIITGNFMPSQTAHINDYMVWSIVNVFLGGLLLGIIAVLLSAQTRKRKMDGDAAAARSMSKLTLIWNVLITIIFFGLTAFLIVYYVVTLSSISTYY